MWSHFYFNYSGNREKTGTQQERGSEWNYPLKNAHKSPQFPQAHWKLFIDSGADRQCWQFSIVLDDSLSSYTLHVALKSEERIGKVKHFQTSLTRPWKAVYIEYSSGRRRLSMWKEKRIHLTYQMTRRTLTESSQCRLLHVNDWQHFHRCHELP